MSFEVWFLNKFQHSADEYSRAQSSSVSPRGGGGYCSSASTPHSSTGGSGSGYGTTSIGNGYGAPIQMSGLSTTSSAANVFNTTSSEEFFNYLFKNLFLNLLVHSLLPLNQ